MSRAALMALVPLALALVLVACREKNGASDDPCSIATADRFSAQVIDYAVTGAENEATDPSAAEGAPDCGQGGVRDLSLGQGGFVTFDLGCQYQGGPGPDLKVWESDESCSLAISESYSVAVSTDGITFVGVGSGFGAQSFDVTSVERFRYVKIVDTGDVMSGPSPGADIDALEVLGTGNGN